MTIIKPCANFTGFSCEGPAVLSNFRTASDPTKLGFCVFSCQAAGAKAKGPLPGLPWIFASTAEGGKLVRMWARHSFAAPAIDCGRTSLVVIDPDVKDGKKGLDAWNALVAMHGPLAAPVVLTPSSGLHVYLRQPPGFPVIRCGRGAMHRHIDVKGVGGYIIAPGALIETCIWRVEDIRALIEKGAA